MERQVLYQIKTLDKMILRTILCNNDINECSMQKIDNKKMPTPTQMHIIAYILKSPQKEVRQKDLEEILNLRRATVSGVLHTMETNGLIIRVTDEKDSRTKKIRLNDKAKDLFIKNKKNIEELEKIIIKDIPENDLDIFFEVIEKMKENIQNADII